MAEATDYTDLISGLLNTALSTAVSNKASDASTNIAAQQAAASQFRPVGITTRFGASGYQYDPTTGRLTGAGYQAAPDVAAMREALLGIAGGGLQQAQAQQAQQAQVNQAAQGLFNVGQQYLAETPQQAAQKWMQQQQQLLSPGREQTLAQLTNQQQQQGRLGLATGGTTAGYTAGGPGLQATNPQMAAYYNALAQQDAQLAAQAQQQGLAQQQTAQGLLGGALNLQNVGYGLQSSALNPFTTSFTGAANLENQALNALTQGNALGNVSTAAAQQAALINAQAQQAAAQQQNALRTNAVSALSDPIAALIGSLFKP